MGKILRFKSIWKASHAVKHSDFFQFKAAYSLNLIHPLTNQHHLQYICSHRALAPDFTAFSAASRVLLVQLSFVQLLFWTFTLLYFLVFFSALPMSCWFNSKLRRNSVIIAPATLSPTIRKDISNNKSTRWEKRRQN